MYYTTRAGCICGLSVALEDIVAFLYKYSTLNYEKQQRKLCLVLAVLLFPCYAGERRDDLSTIKEIGMAHIRFVCAANHAGCISQLSFRIGDLGLAGYSALDLFQEAGSGMLKVGCNWIIRYTFPQRRWLHRKVQQRQQSAGSKELCQILQS